MIDVETSIRDWVERKGDSRWKRVALSFLDYIDEVYDCGCDEEKRLVFLAGMRDALRKLSHPHHSSSSGIHLVLDVMDERLRELGYDVPECYERWRI